MKNKKVKANKFMSWGFFLFAIFCLSVSSAFAVTFSELWTEWGYNNAGTQNRLGDSMVFGSIDNLTEYSQTNYGTFYQPLVNDLDFDGNVDIVVQSSSFLLVYNRTMGLKAQHTVALTGQPTLTETSDLDNGGFVSFESYVLAHNYTEVWIYDFNGSKLTEIYELNVTLDENISLGNNSFKCFFESVTLSSEVCISKYLRYNGTDFGRQTNGGFMSIVIPDTCHNTTCFTVTYWDFSDLNHTLATIPNFYNIDDDGAREVIFWSDFNGDTDIGFSVFHTTAQSRLVFVDDIIDVLVSGTKTYIRTVTDSHGSNNPIMYDLNIGGQGEIYFTIISDSLSQTVGGGVTQSRIWCYDAVGNPCAGFPQDIKTNTCSSAPKSQIHYSSNLVILEDDVCLSGQESGSCINLDNKYGGCVDKDGATSLFTPINVSGAVPLFSTGADFNNDGEDDLITHEHIMDLAGNTTLINWSFDRWVIPVDLDGDSYLDIIGVNDTEMITRLSGGANVGATIDEISSDTGSPSCIGEIVDFTVTDYTDTELNAIKFRIDCFGNGTYTAWSSSGFAPSQSCNFTRYGAFDITFGITDSAHDPTQTDTLVCDWVVDSANCFESGSGGGLTCQAAANATGFSEYHLNSSAVEELTGGGTDLDGYDSKVFDWEGSGCNNWSATTRGLCPAYKWTMQGLKDIWDWIFWYFWAFLTLILIIVVSAYFVKHPEAVERVRERFR